MHTARYMSVAGNVLSKTTRVKRVTVDEVSWLVYGYGSGVGLLCPAVMLNHARIHARTTKNIQMHTNIYNP